MIPKEWKGIASSLQNADEGVPGEGNLLHVGYVQMVC